MSNDASSVEYTHMKTQKEAIMARERSAIRAEVIAELRKGAVERVCRLLIDCEDSRITYADWAKRIVDSILGEEK